MKRNIVDFFLVMLILIGACIAFVAAAEDISLPFRYEEPAASTSNVSIDLTSKFGWGK